MKKVRLTAKIFQVVSRITAILFVIPLFYLLALLCLPATSLANNSWIQAGSGHFRVFFPFTKSVFLLGDYNDYYLSTTLATLALYVIFLWLLGGVFKAFNQRLLFTPANGRRLKLFCLFNLVVPAAVIIFLVIAGKGTGQALLIALLHSLAGIFTFFMSNIFTEGLFLQEEQDLTL